MRKKLCASVFFGSHFLLTAEILVRALAVAKVAASRLEFIALGEILDFAFRTCLAEELYWQHLYQARVQSVRMLAGGVWGLPVFRVADGFGVDAELLAEFFYQCIGSLDLVFCGRGVRSIGYYADSYCLAWAVPCPVRYD
jgi:hypothetical protein